MRSLILIKHSLPEVKADLPSKKWQLSDEGKARAIQLARYLKKYKSQCIYTSDEPKAIQTGEIVSKQLNLPHQAIKDTHENDRSGLKYLPRAEYEKLFKAYFQSPSRRIIGNESAEQATNRFDASVKKIMAEAEKDIILITHGTVMSLFVSKYNDVDVFKLWNSLQLPSIIELSTPGFEVTEVVEAIK